MSCGCNQGLSQEGQDNPWVNPESWWESQNTRPYAPDRPSWDASQSNTIPTLVYYGSGAPYYPEYPEGHPGWAGGAGVWTQTPPITGGYYNEAGVFVPAGEASPSLALPLLLLLGAALAAVA